MAWIALFLGDREWWALAPALLSVIVLTVAVALGIGRMLLKEDDEYS